MTTTLPEPIAANVALLTQGTALLERVTDGAYRACPPGRSAIGAQYRHILDHYNCFLAGVQDGIVDYDARDRDPLVETDRELAARLSRETIADLGCLPAGLDAPLQVHMAVSAHTDDGRAHPSTVGRELLFLVSHTVHHYAIIRLLLEDAGDRCDDDFGMAPSTLANRLAAR